MTIKRKWWATYLANTKSKEQHRIRRIEVRCSIDNMNEKNAIYCTHLWAWWLRMFCGYNGCRWCFTEKDNG